MKEDFPILKDIIYLDSASTSQKPQQVIDAISKYYSEENANVHRGVYTLSEKATEKYEEAHRVVANFINSDEKEIIFTKGTTESLNLVSYTIQSILDGNRKEIILTEMEHHANLIPWQQFAKRHGYTLRFIKIKDDLTLDYEDAKEKINENTAFIAVTHISNALGTVNDVKKLCSLAKEKGALSIVDAAQSVGHRKVDVKDIDCDFLAFSSHKMLGPTGIGVLYGKKELLEKLTPFNFGGDMINTVSYEDATWNKLPMKFEAGTPNIAGAIGLMAAVKYLNNYGIEKIEKHEQELRKYAIGKLKSIEELKLFSPEEGSGVISFNLDIHAHDVASLLNDSQVCIRGGHHCCMPLMDKLGIRGTSRISFHIYNTKEDVDKLIVSLNKALEVFNG